MGNANAEEWGARFRPSPENVDLLKETMWIAEQTGVVRRDPKTREWGPDLDELGDRIGRTTGSLRALRSGGDPTLLTLRRLLSYATTHIAGYDSVRFARACGLVRAEDLAREGPGDPATITEAQLEEARRVAHLSEEDQDLVRDIAHVVRAHRQRQRPAPNAAPGPSAPPFGPDPSAEPEPGARQA